MHQLTEGQTRCNRAALFDSLIAIEPRVTRIPVNLAAVLLLRLRAAEDEQQVRQAVDVSAGMRVDGFLLRQVDQRALDTPAKPTMR